MTELVQGVAWMCGAGHVAKEVELVVTGPGASKNVGDRDFCRGVPVAVWNAWEQALREKNGLYLLKVRKDQLQQLKANCAVSDKSCLDVCNSLQLYRDKQGVHTTYKYIEVLHSICAKAICFRPTHRGTKQPGQWLNVPAAMARLQDRLRVSGHLDSCRTAVGQLAQLALDSNFWINMSMEHCLILALWLDMARWLEEHPFWDTGGSTSSVLLLSWGVWSQLQIKHNSELIWLSLMFTCLYILSFTALSKTRSTLVTQHLQTWAGFTMENMALKAKQKIFQRPFTFLASPSFEDLKS